MGCYIEGCGRKTIARGMCWKHYLRWRRHGDPTVNKRPESFTGRTVSDGYVMILVGKNKYRGEHVLLAEKALGKPLPKGAEVHHVDGDGTNNNTKSPWNLVLCPDHAYHILLHRRARALGYAPPWRGGKLTEAQVEEIRSGKTPQRETAALYGVSKSCIAAIRSGKLRAALS